MMSKKKYNEDDYRFASVKICCRSARLLSPAQFSALCELDSVQALHDRMNECGVTVSSALPDDSLEALLTAFLSESYTELSGFLPDNEICAIMQARFDCHNLKTAIKCRKAGLSPDPYFILSGKIAPETVKNAVESADFSAFPKILADAAACAYRAYAENTSARAVDTMLDAACFTYMSDQAKTFGCKPVEELLSLKADLTNLVTFLRIRKIQNPDIAKQLAADSFVSGGKNTPEVWMRTEDEKATIDFFSESVADRRLILLKNALHSDSTVDEIASLTDSIFYSEALDRSKESLLGIYPVMEYIIRLEYQVKNIRILASGLGVGESADKLREELRGYV